jgi:hypothetical protein
MALVNDDIFNFPPDEVLLIVNVLKVLVPDQVLLLD